MSKRKPKALKRRIYYHYSKLQTLQNCCCAIALGIAARNCEMDEMARDRVKESKSEDGSLFFEVIFYRAKQNGQR